MPYTSIAILHDSNLSYNLIYHVFRESLSRTLGYCSYQEGEMVPCVITYLVLLTLNFRINITSNFIMISKFLNRHESSEFRQEYRCSVSEGRLLLVSGDLHGCWSLFFFFSWWLYRNRFLWNCRYLWFLIAILCTNWWVGWFRCGRSNFATTIWK
jgi:hypothetical protein